jgi:hypothetical protein
MNRVLLFGIVAFLAVVIGFMVSQDSVALAGHGCCGCCGGCYGGYGYGCSGGWGCHGCHGGYGCQGGYEGMGPRKDGGGKPPVPPPPPPPDGKKAEAKPLGFRAVSFTR